MENRQTYFRYDDTNPEAESKEYIQSLREDVEWLGWKPFAVTFTSDYFQQLHTFALQLIRNGKAYVCHQTKADILACRDIARARAANPDAPGDPNSPWRERSVIVILLALLILSLSRLPASLMPLLLLSL